ncbi:protein FAR1-RELATED SEQUENCE 5-like [Beta vulgaris subsp. vulgaris]|uniref:protein FAR1-RELATED SEQUENCE 5-like n=1 Tax=Beta vulgaris subsp. vulgaris TaxID=3555 RepID=UPI00254868C0|nr:protein FAR1-RELATED SEQUENCE 5-like [Beta vulgaris subsp. vulgaris]
MKEGCEHAVPIAAEYMNCVQLVDNDELAVIETPDPHSCGSNTVVQPPAVGMVFGTWEYADDYFRRYGKQEGFGVIGSGSLKKVGVKGKEVTGGEVKKEFRNYTWKCECNGKPDMKRTLKGRVAVGRKGVEVPTRKSKKCNCPVMMYAACNDAACNEGEWVVKKVVLDHVNHNPTPSKSRFISMFRKEEVSCAVRRRLFNDHAVGVRISQIHSSLARERNGLENMAITERDLRNMVAKERKLKLGPGDANAMLMYFNKMAADNQNFFHIHRLDDKGYLKDVLWVDARSRVAYEEFGDVVCFDATYLTNDYELPFANFVGVNHHGQSILLGCALVSHEDAETYEWVFSTWLLCMGGKAPIGILTDQDAAMRKALRNAMPESVHRWCIWHIMMKFGKKLGSYGNYKDLKEALTKAIYESVSPEVFERSWVCAIEKYELGDDEWLQGLFRERDMWVPAYMRHLFWAGMKTTQRCESINSFFDGYVHKTTKLCEFAEQYCNAMESRANAEREADANSSRYLRVAVTTFKTEIVFQKLYTDAKFREIQNECMKVLYLEWTGKQDVGQDLVEHTYEDRVWVVSKDTKKEVPLDRNCEYEIPEKYILRRWRKDVFRKHTMVKVAYHDPSKTDEVQNYDRMMHVFDPICLKAANYGDVHTVLETLQVLNIRLDERHSMKIAGMSLKDCTPTSVGNSQWVQLANGSVGVGSCNRVEKSPNECEGSRIEVNVAKDPLRKKQNGQVE